MKSQKAGEFLEKGLFCGECENDLLGQLDDYSATILKHQSTSDKFDKVVLFDNYDYSKLKLFCVSLVWRASKHSFFDFFLGQKHEEVIKAESLYYRPAGTNQQKIYVIFTNSYSLPLYLC